MILDGQHYELSDATAAGIARALVGMCEPRPAARPGTLSDVQGTRVGVAPCASAGSPTRERGVPGTRDRQERLPTANAGGAAAHPGRTTAGRRSTRRDSRERPALALIDGRD